MSAFAKLSAIDEKLQWELAGGPKGDVRQDSDRLPIFHKAMIVMLAVLAVMFGLMIAFDGNGGGYEQDGPVERAATVLFLIALLASFWRLAVTLVKRKAIQDGNDILADKLGKLGAFSDDLPERGIINCFGLSVVLAGMAWLTVVSSYTGVTVAFGL